MSFTQLFQRFDKLWISEVGEDVAAVLTDFMLRWFGENTVEDSDDNPRCCSLFYTSVRRMIKRVKVVLAFGNGNLQSCYDNPLSFLPPCVATSIYLNKVWKAEGHMIGNWVLGQFNQREFTSILMLPTRWWIVEYWYRSATFLRMIFNPQLFHHSL